MKRLLIFSSSVLLCCWLLVATAVAQDITGDSRGRNWNAKKAAHLLRRAGFGGSPAEVNFLVQLGGKKAAVNYLVDYEKIDNSELEAALARQNFDLSRSDSNINDAKRWWLFRMINTKRPLEEKMTLFWHDHFATSFRKVSDTEYMVRQNKFLRENALGNFRDILIGISKDPAMLIWLDNNLNRATRPNENYARELLELFSMGIGHYTEQDIKEAARAFTGWEINRATRDFIFVQRDHDQGQKTFLGQTGNLNGDQIIDIILQQSVTSRFMAMKLFSFFAYPVEIDDPVVQRLADVFVANNYSVKELMRAIFLSPEFYSSRAMQNMVKNPVEYVVGAIKMLGATLSATSSAADLITPLRNMGMDLFFPPDVDGWVSGVEWINTNTQIERFNFANMLISNRSGGSVRAGTTTLDVDRIIRENNLQTSADVVDYFLNTLVQLNVSVDTRDALIKYLETKDNGQIASPFTLDAKTVDEKVRGVIYLILISPEFQLN